jgi:WD40 repeat protein
MFTIFLSLFISFALCAQDQKGALAAQAVAPITQPSILNVVIPVTDIQAIIKAYCLEWNQLFDAQSFPGFKPIQAVFSPDNKQIAILLKKDKEPNTYSLKFYDLTEQKFRLFKNQLDYIDIPVTKDGNIQSIEFIHNGESIIAKESDYFHVLRVSTGELYYENPLPFYTLAHSSDGNYLANAHNHTLFILGTQNKPTTIPIDWTHHIIFSPDNQYIATANTMHNEIHIYATKTGTLIKSISIGESDNALSSHSFVFSPDSQNLITAQNKGFDSQITIWNIQNNTTRTTSLPIGSFVLAAHPTKNLLAIADNVSNKVILWNLDTDKIDKQWMKLGTAFAKYNLYSLTFSPDGKYIIFAAGELIRAEVETGEIITRIPLAIDNAIAVSPNQKYIAISHPHFKILKAETI